MANCNFCGKTLEKGTGKMFIKDNGKILFFCTRKCEKNLLVFKRKGREHKWTDTYHNEKNARVKEVEKK